MFKITIHWVAVGLFLLFLGLFFYQLYTLIENKQKIEREIIVFGNDQAKKASYSIDEQLKKLEPLVNSLAQDLSSGAVKPEDLTSHLTNLLNKAPDAFRMGVIFLPYVTNPKTRLYAPYVKRENGQLIPYQMEDTIDYTEKSWYHDGLNMQGWSEKPHMSQTTNRLTVGYVVHFKLPKSINSKLDGMVRIDMDMMGIDKMVAELDLGKAGYGFMLAKNGTYMSHPTSALVSQQRTIIDEAEGLDLASRHAISEMAIQGKGGQMNSINTLLQLPILVIIKPIPSSKWILGITLILDDNSSNSITVRRDIINLGCTLLVLIALALLIGFRVYTLEKKRLWHWTSSVSVLFFVGVCLLWTLTIIYPDPPSDQAIPMIGKKDLTGYINNTTSFASGIKKVNLIQIPTGLYLETLRFNDANNVIATGYVWQKVKHQVEGEMKAGFSFPDAEESKINEIFRRTLDDGEIVFYNFEATIQQRAENIVKYPLDQNIVRFRLLPKIFGQQILLVPDLDAYNILNPLSLPGVNKQLILPGWKQVRSNFGFLERSYSTNFGLVGLVNSTGLPELCFDFVISRKFIGPFISSILPVFVVACILFILLMCGTREKDRQLINGFKTTDVLRGAATLLFPIMFAQISLRNSNASDGIMYMEYFYFIIYALILLVVANVLVFTHSNDGIVHHDDNVMPKMLYWPMVTGAFFIVSLLLLY
jgi:hypothetical protein